jgi:ketosteroid isomerase-like protein
MADLPKPPVQAYAKRLWIHGFVAGLVVVGLALGAWLFLSGPAPKEEEARLPAAAAPAPPAAAVKPHGAPSGSQAELGKPLEEVLARLQEATLKKDLDRFLSLYSPAFPRLEEKRRRVARAWQTYDYPKMDFRLAEVRTAGPDKASALVTWEIQTKNRQTGAVKELHRTYRVTFARESGQWRIAALDPWE